MRLSERRWIVSGGLTPEWSWVCRRRSAEALARLERVERSFSRLAPEPLRRGRYLAGMRYFLARRSPERERLLSHPALDYWLFLWDKHFSLPCDPETWSLQFGLFQGFPARLALLEGQARRFDGILDSEAHWHLYGSPLFIEFPRALALGPVAVRTSASALEVRGPGGLRGRFPRAGLLDGAEPLRLESGGVVLRRHPGILPALSVERCGFLTVQGVVMHGLARPRAGEARDFAEVLRGALAHISERDPALYAEMTDMTRVLIPLVNPRRYGSVSSSYVNLRGAICLSHSTDPLLQAETLIHEFCHQKMNQLLAVDPLLLPGQMGQVFYSPWRSDARRLRGLILGAHAFLNVSQYLLRALSREDYPLRRRIAVMCNVARRLFEVDAALRTACGYAGLTEFGRRFVLGMVRELSVLFHAAQWFPPALIREARQACSAHRRDYALPLTGFHKPRGAVPAVRHIPFGRRRVIRRSLPPSPRGAGR